MIFNEEVPMFRKLLSVSILVGATTMPVLAHHPFSAEYDWKKPVTVQGTITKVDWSNPHAHISVDAKDTAGKTKNWRFELGGISALTRAGWDKNTVKTGDSVTVDAWLSRSNDSAGNVKSVKLASGRELSGASSIVEPDTSEKKTK